MPSTDSLSVAAKSPRNDGAHGTTETEERGRLILFVLIRMTSWIPSTFRNQIHEITRTDTNALNLGRFKLTTEHTETEERGRLILFV